MSVQEIIENKLAQGLNLQHLEVVNESHMHNVPPNSETHFKIILVSEAFEKKRMVPRHQMVYGLLQEELDGPVHAMALHTYTQEEWQDKHGQAPLSPPCLGGSKADADKL